MSCEHEWGSGHGRDVGRIECMLCRALLTPEGVMLLTRALARVTAERDEARAEALRSRAVVEAARTLDDACDDAFSSTALSNALWGIRRALAAYDAGRGKP